MQRRDPYTKPPSFARAVIKRRLTRLDTKKKSWPVAEVVKEVLGLEFIAARDRTTLNDVLAEWTAEGEAEEKAEEEEVDRLLMGV